MKRWRVWFTGAALIASASIASASDGQLDPTFGAGGRVFLGWDTDAGVSAQDVAVAVLAPNDGSVILVGDATDSGSLYKGTNAIGVAKLTPAGQFDHRFGDSATPGQTKLHGGGNFPYSGRISANGAALQADGKIVIVGNTYFPAQDRSVATVWRLNADGSPDTGFGVGGVAFIDRGLDNQYDSAIGVTIVQGVRGTTYDAMEGRIVVAGSYDFAHTIVIASSWIFELNPDGSRVQNTTDGKGDNTFDWGVSDCSDNGNYYHDQVFTAIRFVYVRETDTFRFFATGNCIARPMTFVADTPYIAAIDSQLDLVPTFGNSEPGISQLTYVDSAHNYTNSYVTGLAVDPGARSIVYVGYTINPDGTTNILQGGLDASGRLQSGWTDGGVNAMPLGDLGAAARAVVIRPNHGQYLVDADAILAGRFAVAPCQGNEVCGLVGPHFLAIAEYRGDEAPYCGYTQGTICHYEFSGASDQGAYAVSLTEGNKVLLAGYVTSAADGHTDFAVVRLQGDQVFFDGFGYPSTDFQ